jgi:hypothetical protein
MIHTIHNLKTSNLNPYFGFQQLFGSLKHVINLVMWIRYTWCHSFLLGYDSNSHAYRVSNKDSGCVETTCDAVFDETSGSQVEQYDLDVVDNKEDPCEAL